MQTKEYIGLIDLFEAMKRNTRHSWLSDGRHESVAEHSWRLVMMAYFVRDEYPDIDIRKVMMMCQFHDIGEAFTGDVPTFLKSVQDEQKEENVVFQFINTLPLEYRTELKLLFAEMNAMSTPEAKLYKALDKMEAVLQHNQADISTWLPLEYELQMTYGEKEVEFSEFTQLLKEEANQSTTNKIKDKQ